MNSAQIQFARKYSNLANPLVICGALYFAYGLNRLSPLTTSQVTQVVLINTFSHTLFGTHFYIKPESMAGSASLGGRITATLLSLTLCNKLTLSPFASRKAWFMSFTAGALSLANFAVCEIYERTLSE